MVVQQQATPYFGHHSAQHFANGKCTHLQSGNSLIKNQRTAPAKARPLGRTMPSPDGAVGHPPESLVIDHWSVLVKALTVNIRGKVGEAGGAV